MISFEGLFFVSKCTDELLLFAVALMDVSEESGVKIRNETQFRHNLNIFILQDEQNFDTSAL